MVCGKISNGGGRNIHALESLYVCIWFYYTHLHPQKILPEEVETYKIRTYKTLPPTAGHDNFFTKFTFSAESVEDCKNWIDKMVKVNEICVRKLSTWRKNHASSTSRFHVLFRVRIIINFSKLEMNYNKILIRICISNMQYRIINSSSQQILTT